LCLDKNILTIDNQINHFK